MLVLAISSLLNALYFIRTIIRIYSPAEDEEQRWPVRGRINYNIPMAVLTAANLVLGLFSWVIADLIERGFASFV